MEKRTRTGQREGDIGKEKRNESGEKERISERRLEERYKGRGRKRWIVEEGERGE